MYSVSPRPSTRIDFFSFLLKATFTVAREETAALSALAVSGTTTRLTRKAAARVRNRVRVITSLSLLAGAEYRALRRGIQERRSTECRFRGAPFVLLNEGRGCASARSDERRERMAGQMVHVEFPAGDTAKASEFWGSLFGWNFESYPGPSEYLMT